MATKLDQSLDDIVKTQRSSNRRGRGRRAPHPGRTTATAAPVGGVTKPTKATRGATGATTKATQPTAPASGEGKILVSGLVMTSDNTDASFGPR